MILPHVVTHTGMPVIGRLRQEDLRSAWATEFHDSLEYTVRAFLNNNNKNTTTTAATK